MRCTRGAVYDVIVDLRPDSPTFCRVVRRRAARRTARRRCFMPAGLRARLPDARGRLRGPLPDGATTTCPRRRAACAGTTRRSASSGRAAARRRTISERDAAYPGLRAVKRVLVTGRERLHRPPGRSRRCAERGYEVRAPARARPTCSRRARRSGVIAEVRPDAPAAPRLVRASRASSGRRRRTSTGSRRRLRLLRAFAAASGRARCWRARARSTTWDGRGALRRGHDAARARDALRRGQARAARASSSATPAGRLSSPGGASSSSSARTSIPAGSPRRWRRALVRGEPAETGAGTQVRDFLHSEDLGDAFAALLDSGVDGRGQHRVGRPAADPRARRAARRGGRPPGPAADRRAAAEPVRAGRRSPPRSTACATRSAGRRRARSSSARRHGRLVARRRRG